MKEITPQIRDDPCLPRSVVWLDNLLRLLDQNSVQFPYNLQYIEATTSEAVIAAIKEMNVRGAPAISLAGGYGLALAAIKSKSKSSQEFYSEMIRAGSTLKSTRPTAVNLANVIDRILKSLNPKLDIEQQKEYIVKEIKRIHAEEEATYRNLSQRGVELLTDHAQVLTHCNTGALATGTTYGTAIGIIQLGHQQGKIRHVYATETRPRLQGLKITAWELQQLKIPTTIIVEGAVGYVLAKKEIDCILVGADRVLINEQPPYFVLNKIGTLPLAIMAKYYNIPLIVASPYSTFDYQNKLKEIKIELRDKREITHFEGHQIAPENINALNLAFDVTPPDLITAIVTEKEIIYPTLG
ncbi:MAG: S-methyl-5-thioribose-1-phosphate isomerase [Candidatus Heimdallarchaeota archaeon]